MAFAAMSPRSPSAICAQAKSSTAKASLAAGALPIGLAHRVKLKNDVAHGAVVRWSDVEFDAGNETIKTRKAMEAAFGGTKAEGAGRVPA